MVTESVVVVTGSSSGIGRSIATKFASHGSCVVVHGFKNHEGVAETQRLIANCRAMEVKDPKTSGTISRGILEDISNDADCKRLVDEAFDWKGRVDVWVNVAGANVLTGNASKLAFDDKLDLLWRTDVAGTVRISRFVADRMLKQSKIAGELTTGRLPFIVNVSWDQAELGMEGESGQYFGATKAAIAAFSKSLAKTLSPHVRVNCVAPGWIKTDWGQQASASWDARARGESMLNRWGKPEDIANVVYALASPGCEFINGQTIPVNGGWKPQSQE